MSKAEELRNELTGWNALDLSNPVYGLIRNEQQEEIKAINADMRELFMDSELGLRVLKTLMGWTIKKPCVNPMGTERMDVWRGGQDDLVRCILAAIHNSETSGEQNG